MNPRSRPPSRRPLGAVLALALAAILGFGHAATAAPLQNPVISTVAPDPSVLRGPDGAFHVYATSDYWGDAAGYRIVPHFRSFDLVEWEYVGDAFTRRPPWAGGSSPVWAPDVHEVDGLYLMYFTTGGQQPCIGLATAPAADGPWTYAPEPIVCMGDGYHPDLDPMDPFVDFSGDTPVMFMGNFEGVHAVPMSPDATRLVGEPVLVAGAGFEAPTVLRRNGFTHMLLSREHCCLGEDSRYRVVAGRADGQFGPFTDSDGVDLREGEGDDVLRGDDRWVGPGHTAVVSDDSGQDWLLYHAAPRGQAVLPHGIQFRQMLIDRLDWVDDRPVVAGGTPSLTRDEDPQVDLPVRVDAAGEVQSGTAGTGEFTVPVTLASTGAGYEGRMWATITGPDKVRRSVPLVGREGPARELPVSVDAGTEARMDLRLAPEGAPAPGRHEVVVHVGREGGTEELAVVVLQVDAPGSAPTPGPAGSLGSLVGPAGPFGS